MLGKLLNLSVSHKNTNQENRAIRVINLILTLAIFYITLLILLNFYLGQLVVAFVEIGMLIVVFGLIYLQAKGYFSIVKYSFLALLQVTISATSLYLIPGRMSEYLLFLVAIISVFLLEKTMYFILLSVINMVIFYLPQLLYQVYPTENFSWANPAVFFSVMVFAFLRYKSDHEAHEKELRVTIQKLQKSNDYIRRLVNTVVHDLRSPLNRYVGLINLIETEKLTQNQSDELNRMKTLVQDQLQSIDTFLNERRLMAEILDSDNMNPIDLTPFLDSTTESLMPILKAKGQSIEKDLNSSKIQILGDKGLLANALENLVSNASKFSDPGSKVILSTERQEEGTLQINIIDEGPGISEDEGHLVFQEFATLSNKPTGNEQSIGIGLALTREYVESMGYEIGFETDAGKGHFWIKVPRKFVLHS